jgi:hypothetical protein
MGTGKSSKKSNSSGELFPAPGKLSLTLGEIILLI